MNTIDNKEILDRDFGIIDMSIDMDHVETISRNPNDEIIIKANTWKAIWYMAWTLFINMVTIAVASFADLYVAGRLGSNSQAALGLGGQIWFFMVLLAVALSAGT